MSCQDRPKEREQTGISETMQPTNAGQWTESTAKLSIARERANQRRSFRGINGQDRPKERERAGISETTQPTNAGQWVESTQDRSRDSERHGLSERCGSIRKINRSSDRKMSRDAHLYLGKYIQTL